MGRERRPLQALGPEHGHEQRDVGGGELWAAEISASRQPRVTKWHGARQIGNSVPPPLVRAIGERTIQSLKVQPVFPTELKDDALLRMGMAEAAKFWCVPVKIESGTARVGQESYLDRR
jgi:hypothetical protein